MFGSFSLSSSCRSLSEVPETSYYDIPINISQVKKKMRAPFIEFILYAIFCTKVLRIVNFIYSLIYACGILSTSFYKWRNWSSAILNIMPRSHSCWVTCLRIQSRHVYEVWTIVSAFWICAIFCLSSTRIHFYMLPGPKNTKWHHFSIL